ncbi:CopD family protein [Halobacteriales archaeon Cl-PHB]
MSLVATAVTATHLLFAGLWTGSVLFVAYAVVPTAASGDLNAGPLETIAGKLTTLSRVSVLLLFLTGGHMAGTQYEVSSLTGSTPGHLVLAMLALWFVLAGLVELGTSRLTEGASRDKVREPARSARRIFQAASVVAILLLVDGGLLASGFTL